MTQAGALCGLPPKQQYLLPACTKLVRTSSSLSELYLAAIPQRMLFIIKLTKFITWLSTVQEGGVWNFFLIRQNR